jgi:hypothetical protein
MPCQLQWVRKQHTLTRNDEIITFVNRSLESYCGFHAGRQRHRARQKIVSRYDLQAICLPG